MARMMCALVLIATLTAQIAMARPPQEQPAVTPIDAPELHAITAPQAGKVLQDTVWIADWTFDAADGSCDDTGWVRHDGRILNDGTNYWAVTTDYAGAGGGRIDNAAAALRRHDLCWSGDGYGNRWDYSIILKYEGATATLAFKYISDSEPGFDFVTVESDSLGLSEARVNYSVTPFSIPAQFRQVLMTDDGDNSAGVTVGPIALPNEGPGTHEVYIRFSADGAFSPEDGDYPSSIDAAVVVDEIQIAGDLAYNENFEAALNANVTFANTAVATPFGEWARLYKHITDNDKCSENTTCAWLMTDPTRLATLPDMGFGPGGVVIRPWLDDIIVSPWTSLVTVPSANGTILSFRRFPGNRFSSANIVQNWRVRGKIRIENTDTTAPGDSVDCVSPWGHSSMFNSLSTFVWVTSVFDASPYFDPSAREIQFAFRTTSLQIGPPPITVNPGPGPYTDRVRIGRRVLSGPVFDIGIDTRFQAQDRFASVLTSGSMGPYYGLSTDRFGTCDLSQAQDQVGRAGPTIIPGDSITANVVDARLAGGITSVKWYGAIVAGPHAGKAPAPYIAAPNGFFEVNADSARNSSGIVVANRWFMDLDDTYFRGGDRLVYFWYATDAGGGATSAPTGLTSLPASIAAAEVATQGLFEVSYLPAIDWSPAYLARIAADTHGDLAPTAEELAVSTQRNCLLYYQRTTSNRRSDATSRTSFMRTLDALGYHGDYDIYDIQGCCGANNQLGSRATIEQCTGYQLIVEDDGRSNLTPNIPDRGNYDNEKVGQATFYRNWLDAGASGEAGRATLWIIGESTVAEFPTNVLFTSYCGSGYVLQGQGETLNPDVVGSTSLLFAPSSCSASFANDRFSLNGGCPAIRNYDGYSATGTAVATHHYQNGATQGPVAILMNARPATNANTILMGFAWSDIRDPSCVPPDCPVPIVPPAKLLMSKILACALTPDCQESHDPTTVPGDDVVDVPAVSALHPNMPNPFNPTTTIAFDLSRAGHVRLEVFDVAGRSVRVLVDDEMPAGRGHRVSWNGLDTAGVRASTGLYFFRLTAPDLTATRKMIVMK